jgi:ABC-type Na+ efflux pump permease subunit/membrane protease YdiL (CAAX protease family)
MISFKNVKIIFRKEFLQIMRDKSVLFTNFFIPLFGVPLYFIFALESVTYMNMKKAAPLKNDTVFKVSYQGKMDPSLKKVLEEDKKVEIVSLEEDLSKDLVDRYRNSFADYSLAKKKNMSVKLEIKDNEVEIKRNEEFLAIKTKWINALKELKAKYKGQSDLHLALYESQSKSTATYFFHYEENNVSNSARKYVKKLIQKHSSEKVAQYKKDNSIQIHNLRPYTYWDINIENQAGMVAKIFGLGFGGGILFLLLVGIFNPAINTTIGERDLNTYKVLLMNPLSLHEIFIGKYLNVAFLGLLVLLPYALQGSVFYGWLNSKAIFDFTFELTFLKVFMLFLGTVSASLFISSICFLTCSFAKTRQQAQSLLTLLMFAIAIPIAVAGAMELSLNSITAWIPLVNFPMLTENLLQPTSDYTSMIISILSNFGFSMIVIWFTLNMFNVQWKGSNESNSLNDILDRKEKKITNLVPAHSFLAFAICFLGFTYGSFLTVSLKLDIFAYFLLPLMFCLGTALAVMYYSKLDITKTFKWKGLDKIYAGKIIVASFLMSVAFNLIIRDTGALEMFKVDFPPIFDSSEFASYLGAFFLFAVLPGFSEEFLFRGVIFNGMRSQYSLLVATIVSSVMFAIIHFSMFKFGHTLILGLFLAPMYEKRGLLACMFTHMVFNSAGLLLSLNSTLSNLLTGNGILIKLILVPGAFVAAYYLLKSEKIEQLEIEIPVEEEQKEAA